MTTSVNILFFVSALVVSLAMPLQKSSRPPSDSPIEAQCCYDHTTQASLSISQEDLLKRFEEYVLQTADLTNHSRESMEKNTIIFEISDQNVINITKTFQPSGLSNESTFTDQQVTRLQVLLQMHNYLSFLKSAVCGNDKLQRSLEYTTCILSQLMSQNLSCDMLFAYVLKQPDPVIPLDQMTSQAKRMMCYVALGGVQDTMELAMASIHES